MIPGWRPPVLETDRLVLRPVTEADAGALFAACSNPNVTRFTLFDTYRSPADAVSFVRGYAAERYAEMVPDPFAVTLRHDPDPRLVGAIGCPWASRNDRTMELGYWLAEHLWGRGLAAEAARAVVAFAFRSYPVDRVQARVIVGNRASARVLEKVGFRCEGTLRSAVVRRGVSEDVRMYAALRREWPG